jgi:hypothetical protein
LSEQSNYSLERTVISCIMAEIITAKLTEKPMGRPPVPNRLRQKRRQLAVMIDEALKAGQRGDGTPKQHWQPWTEVDFAREAHTGPSSVSDWRDSTDPSRPGNIIPILKVFYGDIPAYAEAKAAMLKAWKLAGGIDADDPADPRDIKLFSAIAEVVHLMVNQPTPDNHGNLIVPYTLRLRCDEKRQIEIRVDGSPVTVAMDIGVTKPVFKVRSDVWQPIQDSIFRKKKHPHSAPGPCPDSILLTGERDTKDRVVGEPLEDEPYVVMEKSSTDVDAPIILSVVVPRDGLSVTLCNDAPPTVTQDDVIAAILAEAIPRDKENSSRLEVTSAVVKPSAAKSRP